MAAQDASYRINYRRGDRFTFSLRYLADGSPVDLTGYDAEMIISWPDFRNGRGPMIPEGSILMDSDGGEITLGGAQGTIEVARDAVDPDPVPFGSPYVAWQLRIFSTSLNKETLLSGEVYVLDNLFEGA